MILYCNKRNLESSRRCTGTRPRKSRYHADTYTVIYGIYYVSAQYLYLITLYIYILYITYNMYSTAVVAVIGGQTNRDRRVTLLP